MEDRLNAILVMTKAEMRHKGSCELESRLLQKESGRRSL